MHQNATSRQGTRSNLLGGDTLVFWLTRFLLAPGHIRVFCLSEEREYKVIFRDFTVFCSIDYIKQLFFHPTTHFEDWLTTGYVDEKWRIERGELESVFSMSWRIYNAQGFLQRCLIRLWYLIHRIEGPAARRRQSEQTDLTQAYPYLEHERALFSAMLDKTMHVSSGIFEPEHKTLTEAQENKAQKVLTMLDLKPGDTVLDIGCGWGSMARALVDHGCTVVGITNSQEQYDWCMEHASAEAGEREQYHLLDYQSYFTQHPDVRFDAIVCIEVIEYVGKEGLTDFFSSVHKRLHQDGKFFLHNLVRTFDMETAPWFDQHIYAGCYAPTHEVVEDALRSAQFHADSFSHIPGFHYAETLRQWRQNFRSEQSNLEPQSVFTPAFKRRWLLFLATRIAVFNSNLISIYHTRLRRNDHQPGTESQADTL